MSKLYRNDSFEKDGANHFLRIQPTGNSIPQPARIILKKEYWEDVGGLKGWETTVIYDKTFEDWAYAYAYAVYNEILRRSGRKPIRRR